MRALHYVHRFYTFIALSILFLLFIRCAVPQSPVFHKDGQIYGKIEGQWGGIWWNYYQRGISYAVGEYWDYSIKDLYEAIRQRPSDQRRARTYGLHILDEYFPHRELGVIFYHQKRFREAIVELEKSLKQFESAKAKYYLNLARQGFLQETGLDIFPPELIILSPQPGISTRFSHLTIQGKASDDQFIGSVYVDNQKLPLELSQPTFLFDSEIKLKRGKNVIPIEAIDLAGKKIHQEIILWCDQEAPLIYVDKFYKDPLHDECIIEGYISDMSQIAGFWLNGESVDFHDKNGGDFSATIHITNSSPYILFRIEDSLGNFTTGEMSLQEVIKSEYTNMASLHRIAFSSPYLNGILASNKALPSEVKRTEKKAPVIKIKDLPETLTVEWDECFIEGEVRDAEGVNSITINEIPLMTRTAKLVFFNFLIPLTVGENLITIHAKSITGGESEQRIHIRRKQSLVREIGSRWKIAIIPFKYNGEKEEIRGALYESLLQNFVTHKRFQVVEREKIDGLFLQEKDIIEDSQEIGKIVSAEGILVGSAYFYNNHLELIARVIDTETTVVIHSEEVFGPIDSMKDVVLLTEGLSLKFEQSFPLVEGQIINKDLKSIQIDIGKKEQVLPYMKVVFFKEGEPITLAGSDKILEKRWIILGEGKIIKVYDRYADTVIVTNKDKAEINVGDFVITK